MGPTPLPCPRKPGPPRFLLRAKSQDIVFTSRCCGRRKKLSSLRLCSLIRRRDCQGGGVCDASRSHRILSPFAEREPGGVGKLLHPRITRGAGVSVGLWIPSEGAQEPQSQTLIPETWSTHLQTTFVPPAPPQTFQVPTVKRLREGSTTLEFREEGSGSWEGPRAWETGIHSGCRQGSLGPRVESGRSRYEVTGHRHTLHSREVGRVGAQRSKRFLRRGPTEQGCWTQTSLSQLESSSKPCSAQAGCRVQALSAMARAAAARAGEGSLSRPPGSPGSS